jgi:hypothetical protein
MRIVFQAVIVRLLAGTFGSILLNAARGIEATSIALRD